MHINSDSSSCTPIQTHITLFLPPAYLSTLLHLLSFSSESVTNSVSSANSWWLRLSLLSSKLTHHLITQVFTSHTTQLIWIINYSVITQPWQSPTLTGNQSLTLLPTHTRTVVFTYYFTPFNFFFPDHTTAGSFSHICFLKIHEHPWYLFTIYWIFFTHLPHCNNLIHSDTLQSRA